MYMFVFSILIIQKISCIINFLHSALAACGPAKESWSMFIIKTSPCALTVPTKCAALNCTTTISTCSRTTEESSHPLRSSTQTFWHRYLQWVGSQDTVFHYRTFVFGTADFFAAHLKPKLIREDLKEGEARDS